MPEETTSEEVYLIMQGVHRCLAASLAGMTRVFATIENREGNVLGTRIIDIDLLYTRKQHIGRWDRGRDFHDLIEMVQTPEGRNRLYPVFVERIEPARAVRQTRLLDVKVSERLEDQL